MARAATANASGGWFGALLGLGALAVLAFSAGGVAGLVWKEPGLLIAYLRGDTTEIAWSTTPAEPARPPVAAAPEPAAKEPAAKPAAAPAPKAAAKAVAKPVAPAAPKPAKPTAPSVAAAPPGSIAIQVGAFEERSVADKLRRRLREAGFPAYLTAAASPGDPWRVRVGPYRTKSEAEPIASKLKSDQKLPTWVLDEDAES